MSYDMGYYPFMDLSPQTAPPITITATPAAAAAATIRAATTYITPPSNYSAPLPSPQRSLSGIARILTRALFDSIPLPQDLTDYRWILDIFAPAAVVGAVYAYGVYNTSRARVKLAIYHVLRGLRIDPRFQRGMLDSAELIAVATKEVDDMMQEYGQLSKREGEETLQCVKRKIELYVDDWNKNEARRESESKKRKLRHASVETTARAAEMEVKIPSSPPGYVRAGGAPAMNQAASGEDAAPSPTQHGDEDMMDYDSTVPETTQEMSASPVSGSELSFTADQLFGDFTPMSSSSTDGNPSIDLSDSTDGNTYNYPSDSSDSGPESDGEAVTRMPSAMYGTSTYKYPSSSSSSDSSSAADSSPPTLAQPTTPTPSHGRSQAQAYGHVDTPRPKVSRGLSHPKMREQVEDEDSVEDGRKNVSATRQQGTSTSIRNQNSSQPRNDTSRPRPPQGLSKYIMRNSALQRAPQSTELLPSHAAQEAQAETSKKAVRPALQIPPPSSSNPLSAIPEGISPQQSPAEGTTEYRAAGTRKFYGQIAVERSLRRGLKTLFGWSDAQKEGEDGGKTEVEIEIEAEVMVEAGPSAPIASPATQEAENEDAVVKKAASSVPVASPAAREAEMEDAVLKEAASSVPAASPPAQEVTEDEVMVEAGPPAPIASPATQDAEMEEAVLKEAASSTPIASAPMQEVRKEDEVMEDTVLKEAASSTPIASAPMQEVRKEDEATVTEEQEQADQLISSPKPSPILTTQARINPSPAQSAAAKASHTPTTTPPPTASRHKATPPTTAPSDQYGAVQPSNAPETAAPPPDATTPAPTKPTSGAGRKPRTTRKPQKKKNPGEAPVGVRKSARITNIQANAARSNASGSNVAGPRR